MRKPAWGSKAFFRSDQGVTTIEYALIAGLIAVVIIVAVASMGDQVKGLYTYVAGKVTVAVGTGGS
jgi:pilus assembly protein Flp/PilA